MKLIPTAKGLGPNHMSDLFITENLEVITKTVTVRENFLNGDMMVLENGAYIPATLRQGQGIVTGLGTLLLKKRRVPCRWKRVKEITAVWIERTKGVGTVLVDNDQHIYIPTFDLATAALNCPANYWWTETRNPKIRVAQKVIMDSEEDRHLPELPAGKVMPVTSMETQLDYAFHSLGKKVQARITD